MGSWVTWLCVDAKCNDEGCDRPHASVSSAVPCWMPFEINVKHNTATNPWKWMDMSTYHSVHFTQRERRQTNHILTSTFNNKHVFLNIYNCIALNSLFLRNWNWALVTLTILHVFVMFCMWNYTAYLPIKLAHFIKPTAQGKTTILDESNTPC